MKRKLILGIIGGLIMLVVLYIALGNKPKDDTQNKQSENTSNSEDNEGKSDEEIDQEYYNKIFGEPPTGFKWSDDGELIALGDANTSSEEVAYTYMKAVAMLDFDSAEKYSNGSSVLKTYKNYYEDYDYTIGFKRRMYKEVLKSIVVDKIADSAIFADGSTVFTFKISCLDLTNKDFWKGDSNKIYNDLYTYYRDEKDSTKAKQYVYDYILNWYSSDSAPRHDITLELKVSKSETGGWLVTGDDDLDTLCKYDEGELVNSYILNCYNAWLEEKEK